MARGRNQRRWLLPSVLRVAHMHRRETPRLPVDLGYEAFAVKAASAVLVWTGADNAQLYAFTP